MARNGVTRFVITRTEEDANTRARNAILRLPKVWCTSSNATRQPGANRHYILTSDFDAALRFWEERNRGCRQRGKDIFMGWHGAVQQSTLQTMVEVREYPHWFVHFGFLYMHRRSQSSLPNPRLAGRVFRVMGKEILLLTAYFENSVGFHSDINATILGERISISHPVCGKTCLFMQPASGSKSWEHRWSLQWVPHACRTGRGQKPDIIDYFLVSTLIRPLVQKCEVVKSVLWGQHNGARITLNTDSRQLMGKQQTKKPQHTCTPRRTGTEPN